VMVKHETGCTSNPVRVCRMCGIAGFAQKSGAELFEAAKKGTAALRELAEGCPACMLAGIKQLRAWQIISMSAGDDFPDFSNDDTCGWEFKKECAEFWQKHNNDHADHQAGL